MKTAKGMVENFITEKDLVVSLDGEIYGKINANWIVELIQSARKEAIEEAAKRAQAYISLGNDYCVDTATVDQQSILSLIDELK